MGKQGSFRTTITVPLDLKKRMDAVKEGMNWSAIACRAFEAKLAEIASRKAEKNMETILQRLRRSKLETEAKTYKDGYEMGRDWAGFRAEWGQLAALGRLAENRSNWAEWFTMEGRPPASHRLAELWSDKGSGRPDVRLFWSRLLGKDGIPDDDFVRGFADGALGIWQQIVEKI